MRNVAAAEGDGAGYNVLSFGADGKPRYIEVKTTRGGKMLDFFSTPNGVAFSRTHADNYELRRLYNYDGDEGPAASFRSSVALMSFSNSRRQNLESRT